MPTPRNKRQQVLNTVGQKQTAKSQQRAAREAFIKRHPIEGETLLELAKRRDDSFAKLRPMYAQIAWLVEFTNRIRKSALWEKKGINDPPPNVVVEGHSVAILSQELISAALRLKSQLLKQCEYTELLLTMAPLRKHLRLLTDRLSMFGAAVLEGWELCNQRAAAEGRKLPRITNADLGLASVAVGIEFGFKPTVEYGRVKNDEATTARIWAWKKRRSTMKKVTAMMHDFHIAATPERASIMQQHALRLMELLAAGADPNTPYTHSLGEILGLRKSTAEAVGTPPKTAK